MTDHPKIDEARLREIIADDRETPLHAMSWVERLSACTELLALREATSLPGYTRLVEERDAARAEAEQAAEQPKPCEPRPWWVVFGLERWEATKLHALHPTEIERRIGSMVDIAGKRQIHPTEIARALDEARAELLADQPKPEVAP